MWGKIDKTNFLPKEIPSLNILCHKSVKTWNIIRRCSISYNNQAYHVLDFGYTTLIFVIIGLLIELIIVDILKLFEEKNSVFNYEPYWVILRFYSLSKGGRESYLY